MYVLGRDELMAMKDVFCCDNALNMTYLALNLSHYVNGVVKKHGEVSRLMFAGYAIDAITNGVHVPTSTSPAFEMLFDRYIPSWREDSFNLRYVLSIPPQEVWATHSRAKIQLIKFINPETNAGFDMHDLTLYAEAWFLPSANNIPDGFATEGTTYNFFKGEFQGKSGVIWDPGRRPSRMKTTSGRGISGITTTRLA